MYQSIAKEINLPAKPEQVYRALTDSATFSAFSGAPAKIEAVAGGYFECFGGQILGRNIEMETEKHLIQAWRASVWPAGVYSIVEFSLTHAKKGTNLKVNQQAPANLAEHLEAGWGKMYFDPLKKYLSGNK